MLLPLFRKEKKEATADWMEIYEESEGGMEVFNVAKDYLMAQLRKQDSVQHLIDEGAPQLDVALYKLLFEAHTSLAPLTASPPDFLSLDQGWQRARWGAAGPLHGPASCARSLSSRIMTGTDVGGMTPTSVSCLTALATFFSSAHVSVERNRS